MKQWIVDTRSDGRRLDAILRDLGAATDVRTSRRLIEGGRCQVNGRRVTRSSHRCHSGDRLETSSPPILDALEVLWREGGLAAVVKPRGLECSLAGRSPLRGLLDRTGLKGFDLAHRLDAETTGLLLLANRGTDLDVAQNMFRSQACQKTYLAICQGHPHESKGTLRGHIARLGIIKGRARFGLSSVGQEVVTDYRVLGISRTARCALITFSPHTGRTHQIRVQTSSWGHPILGDTLYGKDSSPPWVPGLLLHAWALEFLSLVTSAPTKIVAHLPPDFRNALDLAGLGGEPQLPEFQSS